MVCTCKLLCIDSVATIVDQEEEEEEEEVVNHIRNGRRWLKWEATSAPVTTKSMYFRANNFPKTRPEKGKKDVRDKLNSEGGFYSSRDNSPLLHIAFQSISAWDKS